MKCEKIVCKTTKINQNKTKNKINQNKNNQNKENKINKKKYYIIINEIAVISHQ